MERLYIKDFLVQSKNTVLEAFEKMNTNRNGFLVVVAEDIVIHTDPDCFANCEANGTTPMRHVLFLLSEACHSTFEEGD